MPQHKPAKTRSSNTGLSLSPEDVASLMSEDSSAALVDITDKMASAYSGQNISAVDSKAAEQIFRLLLRETEVQVRKTLAEHIKASTTIPKDIVLILAHDVAEVSVPILQYSEVLSDKDLLELIEKTKDNERFLAIAQRKSVSEPVSGKLLDKGGEEVVTSLVGNHGAKISEEKLAVIVASHPDNATLMQTLRNRPQLPAAIVQKMVHAVTQKMSETLKEKHALPEKELEQEIDKTRDSETLRLVRQSVSQEDIDRLINQLIAFDRLTPSLILAALCQGDFHFFETSMARLSNVPLANARTLINDRGDLGFRAIYNKSGLPDTLFASVRLLLKTVQVLAEKGENPNKPGYGSRVVEQLLQHPLPVENLSYMVALIRKSAL